MPGQQLEQEGAAPPSFIVSDWQRNPLHFRALVCSGFAPYLRPYDVHDRVGRSPRDEVVTIAGEN
jgi:hypothetical protein